MMDLDRGKQNEPENRESKAFDTRKRRTSGWEKTAQYKAYNKCDRHGFEPYNGDEANADAEENVM